jgi:hypothetical protein
MAPRSPDDHRPDWYVWLEHLVEGLMRGSVLLIWVWGLAVFLFVAWGIWRMFFSAAP